MGNLSRRQKTEEILVVHLVLLSLIYISGAQHAPYIQEIGLNSGETSVRNVAEGASLAVLPSVDGQPPPTVTFYKDGVPIPEPHARDGRLQLTNISKFDAGFYWIVANNSIGAVVSKKVQLAVYYVEPWSDSESVETRRVQLGDAVVIDVPQINALPQPEKRLLTWHSSNSGATPSNVVNTDESTHISSDMRLIILSTQSWYTNWTYQATYTNSLTIPSSAPTSSRMFRLEVTGPSRAVVPPTFAVELPETSYITNFPRFECVVNGRLGSSQHVPIRWFHTLKGGSTRNNITANANTYGRLINIPNLSEGDTVECEAGSGSEKITSSTTISPIVKPKFSGWRLQSSYSVDLNSDVSLPCDIDRNPAGTLIWYKNADEIRSDHRFTILPNGTLKLSSVQLNDSAVYQCLVQNVNGFISDQTVLKLNSAAPTIPQKPEDQTLTAGGVVSLSCSVDGQPNPDVYWTFRSSDGTTTQLATAGRLTVTRTEVRISPAKWSDSGSYTCKANNSLGNAEESATLIIYNQTSIINNQYSREERKASSVTRSCLLNKDSRITSQILWFHDKSSGQAITNGPYRSLENNNQTLRLSALRYWNDDGNFTCRVYSEAGNATQTYEIIVTGVPIKPETAASLSATLRRTITITWRKPFNGNRNITHYIISYKQVDRDINFQTLSSAVGKDETSYTASDLKPAKSYQFILSAVNSVGEGQASEPTSPIKIPPEAPSAPPIIVSLSPVNKRKVRVSFSPPPRDQWNSERLSGYKIAYQETATSGLLGVLDHVTSAEGLITVDIPNLTPYTDYWIKVAAYNEVNTTEPLYSAPQKVTTDEDVPQAPPIIHSAESIGSTQCRVMWRRPPSHSIKGQTKGYRVIAYKGGDEQQAVRKTVNSTVNDVEQTELSSLAKFTFYRINVSLFTNGGDSPPATTNCTTLEDVPDAVDGLAVLEYAYNSITVSWSRPPAANGILLYYTVTITGPGRESGVGYNVTDFTNSTTSYTIPELSSESRYSVSVRAATAVGLGPDSVVSETTRPDPVRPGTAAGLSVDNIQSRSVEISFDSVYDGQAPITQWIVKTRSNEKMEWANLTALPGYGSHTRMLVLEQLTPYTEYYFCILAVNIKGPAEDCGSTGLVRTLMTNPEGPPFNISMRPQNSSTVIINWEPLNLSLFNGDAAGYRVEYKSEYDLTTWHNVTVGNPSTRFFILGGLNAYTMYTVQIISVNRKFESSRSEAASARTIGGVPKEGPPNLQLSMVPTSTKQIDVIWSAIANEKSNGLILGYKVVYKPSDSRADAMSVTTTATNTRLEGLISFTHYQIQVLGFTRTGDGALSEAKTITTRADKASAPRSLSLQYIEPTSLTLSWLPPQYLNSPASSISYTLRYAKADGSGAEEAIEDIGHTARRSLAGLEADTEYRFDVRAVNNEGEGIPSVVTVTTRSSQSIELPAKPENLMIGSKSARSMTLRWNQGSDYGFPIRNYTLKYRTKNGVYQTADDYIGGQLQSFTLENLHPDTKYYFKLAARNDIGLSAESTEITDRTEVDKPELAPSDLSIVPKTATALNITWVIADQSSWNGQLTKTRIWYTKYNDTVSTSLSEFSSVDVVHPISTYMLERLEAGNLYEITLSSVNSKGHSDPAQHVVIFVGVAVPVGAPSINRSTVAKEKEITLSWDSVPISKTNGQLLGYKVYYKIMGPVSRRKRASDTEAQYELVGPEDTSYTLKDLEIFRQYEISVTAYNIAGEGPRSPTIIASTAQGLPGPPANLSFNEITLNLLNVTWDMPEKPNGKILHYIIKYYPADEAQNVLSTSRLISHPKTFDEIKISREMTFNFTIIAVTKEGPGEPLSEAFTTGPRTGVPSAPSTAEYSKEDNGVLIKWSLDSDSKGDGPIKGYVVEGLDIEWKLVLRDNDGSTEKVLLSKSMVASNVTYSRYRVSLFNDRGLGEAKEADEVVPYYKTWWFLVIIALAALVIIIIITAVLCCYCYRMRAKLAEEAYEQDVIGVENEYNTYEMRQSFKRENRRGSKYRAEPPRPSPGAVMYSADEAPPMYDDNSSVTEKGDLTSDEDEDTKGNVSGTDSSDDDIDKTGASSAAPSYNNYQYGGYNHYVQSGAVQQSWQNSFGRGKNPHSMYAYTDSEAESSMAPSTSHYRSTNGLLSNHSNARNGSRQHLVLNSSPENTPGSRAHLPNFSSFV